MAAQDHEHWKGRGFTNETKEELNLRLFDDEGIRGLLKSLPPTHRTIVITHSNNIKHLLVKNPEAEKQYEPKKARVRVDNACIYPYQFEHYH